MTYRSLLLAGCLLLISFFAQAQILDDSTKQVYGPTTTRFFLERDMLASRDTSYTIDTLLHHFHNYNFINRSGNRYADLGNLGTALRPVFYTPPAQIGVYSGINAYNPYFYYPDDVRYFDTHSPYTSLYYVQGGLAQQLLRVDFSRNITPRWNAGFDYQRLTAGKQFAFNPNREGDRGTDHHAFVFHTSYHSKDSAYQLLAHLSHLNHTSYDQGGILDEPLNFGDQDLILIDFSRNASAQLRSARTSEVRMNYHLYHQYSFAKGFQLFHIFDRQMQRYAYIDRDPKNAQLVATMGRPFYPYIFSVIPYNYTVLDTARIGYYSDSLTQEKTQFEVWENKFGIKGTLAGWDYRLYGRYRSWHVGYVPFIPLDIERSTNANSEAFIGLWTQYRFGKNIRLNAEGELMLVKDYRLGGTIESPWFRGSYYSTSYSPAQLQQKVLSNTFYWDNNFRNTQANQIFGQLILKWKGLELMPSLTLINLNNYVYFDELSQARQAGDAIQLVYAGVNLNYSWKVFHFENEFIYTLRNGPDVIRIPELFLTSRLYAEGALFKKALYMQLGAEVHYRSTYYGDAYMPAIGQFHLQNEFPLKAYPVVDVFANARIGRVRLFAKFAHVNQGFTAPGYFVTPYFPGQIRTLAFGVNWLMFD